MTQRARSHRHRALAVALAVATAMSGCYARVTVTNPRGATTQDLELGQNIAVELRDGRKLKTRYRGMQDGGLITDDGRFPLDQVRSLSYWIDDDPKPLPLLCCAVLDPEPFIHVR